MAEYLGATAPRRRSIIQAARFPKRSVVARYDKARECLVDFLVDGTRSLNHMARAIDNLEKREARPGVTSWIKQDCRFSIEAIQSFERSYNRIGLAPIMCEAINGRLPPLVIGPTKISVALDAITRKRNGNGPDSIGGVFLLFSRGEGTGKQRIERCKTVAGIAYEYCAAMLASRGAADTSICFGVDVFGGRAYQPQGTFARKRRQIEDSCDEIAASWKLVKPPSDYDGPDPH